MTDIASPIARTMSGQIITLIRERILAGVYPPGSQLLQDGIAAEFDVSKIPVREALVQLSAEGLVDIFAHRGFQVRPLSASEALEIFHLRRKIEPAAMAEGARQARDDDRGAAHAALVALNEAVAAKNLGLSADLNCKFHLALIVPRCQPVTAEIASRLLVLSQRYVRLRLQSQSHSDRTDAEHMALYTAWAAGQAREVSRMALAHLRRPQISELPGGGDEGPDGGARTAK